MSSSRVPQSKSDQLTQQWFRKAAQTLCDARLTGFDAPPPSSSGSSSSKGAPPTPSRWFNLDLPSQDHFKQELAVYRTVSLAYGTPSSANASAELRGGGSGSGRRGEPGDKRLGTVPAFVIEFVLDLTAVGENQVLMFEGQDGEAGRVKLRRGPGGAGAGGQGRNPNFVIERWRIGLDTDVDQRTPLSHLSNSSSYKRLIPVFRALYTLLRLLPAHRLQRRIRGGRRATGFRIGAVAYQEGHSPRDQECVGLEQPIEVEGGLVEEELGKWEFDGVEHMYGNFTIQGSYRPTLGFYVEDKDAVASSNLLNEDYFTPSMARQPSAAPSPRPTSLAAQPSSGRSANPTQLPLPESLPPEPVPAPRRLSATVSQRPRFGSVSSRAMLESLSGGVSGSPGSSGHLAGGSFSESSYAVDIGDRPRRSSELEERMGVPVPGAPRTRRSSFYGEEKTSHSPSSLSLSRRPAFSPIQAFKSGTLSSSPQPSSNPLRSATIPATSSYNASPSSSLLQPRSSLSRETGSHIPSSLGRQPIPISRTSTSSQAVSGTGSPRTPSSPGQDSSSSTTPAVPIVAPPMSKRYSSSFTHRQGRSFSTLSSSVASSITRQPTPGTLLRPGSGGGGSGGSLTRGQSILSAANSALEADAELQAFVNLIDSRPTLSAPLTLGSSSFLPPSSAASPPSLSRLSLTSGAPAPATTKSQLSEALKRMAASYTGFGPASSGTVPEGVESSSSPTSPTSRSPDSPLHLNISPPSHKRPFLGATSPIAPSPLRASTEAPPPPPPALHTPPSFLKSSPLAGPSTSTTTTSSTVTSPFPHTINLPSSLTTGSLRSPRERKQPVLMRGGFGSLEDNHAADVPLPSSHDGRWSPNPLGSPNALSAMSTSPGFLRGGAMAGTGAPGFGISREGSRSPSIAGTHPSTALQSRTPSQSPGPATLPRQGHAHHGAYGSRPPPASPLSSSPPLSGTSVPFSLAEAAGSPRFAATRGVEQRRVGSREEDEEDVLGRFELDEEEEEPVRPAVVQGRSGSVGRRAGGVEYGEVGGVMGRGGWPAGYGRSG